MKRTWLEIYYRNGMAGAGRVRLDLVGAGAGDLPVQALTVAIASRPSSLRSNHGSTDLWEEESRLGIITGKD